MLSQNRGKFFPWFLATLYFQGLGVKKKKVEFKKNFTVSNWKNHSAHTTHNPANKRSLTKSSTAYDQKNFFFLLSLRERIRVSQTIPGFHKWECSTWERNLRDFFSFLKMPGGTNKILCPCLLDRRDILFKRRTLQGPSKKKKEKRRRGEGDPFPNRSNYLAFLLHKKR